MISGQLLFWIIVALIVYHYRDKTITPLPPEDDLRTHKIGCKCARCINTHPMYWEIHGRVK